MLVSGSDKMDELPKSWVFSQTDFVSIQQAVSKLVFWLSILAQNTNSETA